jgi:hypothetical protein
MVQGPAAKDGSKGSLAMLPRPSAGVSFCVPCPLLAVGRSLEGERVRRSPRGSIPIPASRPGAPPALCDTKGFQSLHLPA